MGDNRRTPSEWPGVLKSIRKIFGSNIATVFFGVILIYMIFSAIIYFTSAKVESYQVTSGPLSRNETYTGIVLCEESVFSANTSGYITYYAREGSKISAGGAVYGIGSSQKNTSDAELSSEDLASIRSSMMNFSKGFNSSSFNSTYSFKYGLEGNILQYAGVTGSSPGTEDGSGSSSNVVSYAGQSIVKSSAAGIVLYGVDGYESKTADTLTNEDFDQKSYHKTDLKTDESIKAGDQVYTLITSENWSLVIPLSDKQAAKLGERTSVRVKFLKDNTTQSGDFSIIEIGGIKYGKIDFNKGLIRYASNRFLEIELVTNTVTGLKIPLTSIVTKEFYKISSKYAVTDKESNEMGFMVQQTDGNGDTTLKFVSASVCGYDMAETSAEDDAGTYSSETEYIYYVDQKNFSEGDIIVSQEDQSKYTIHEVGVLQGVYCINQGYSVFRRIELLDQNEEYAIISTSTSYGLSKYDRIVRNADKVNENEILY